MTKILAQLILAMLVTDASTLSSTLMTIMLAQRTIAIPQLELFTTMLSIVPTPILAQLILAIW
jgi:hypothetical protein